VTGRSGIQKDCQPHAEQLLLSSRDCQRDTKNITATIKYWVENIHKKIVQEFK
jgi:hypothetical protein